MSDFILSIKIRNIEITVLEFDSLGDTCYGVNIEKRKLEKNGLWKTHATECLHCWRCKTDKEYGKKSAIEMAESLAKVLGSTTAKNKNNNNKGEVANEV